MTPESSTTGDVSNYEVLEFSSVGNEVYRNVHFYRGTEEQIVQEARFFLSTCEGAKPDQEIIWDFENQNATREEHSLKTGAGSYFVAARKINGIEDIHFGSLS